MKKQNKEKSVIKTRNFATIVYDDSAPSNWREILENLHIPLFISPYHDRDINPDGTPKKPHWHVQFVFDGPKTLEQVKNIVSTFNGVGVEVLLSLRGYARYLCHLDNPEKAQYNKSDVTTLGDLDYSEICICSLDKYRAIEQMMFFCKDNNIYSFSKLSLYACQNQFDWFKILCDCGAVFMKSFLQSFKEDNERTEVNRVYILSEETSI